MVVFIWCLKRNTNEMNKFEEGRVNIYENTGEYTSGNVIRFQIQKQTHTYYAKEKLHSTLWLIRYHVHAFYL